MQRFLFRSALAAVFFIVIATAGTASASIAFDDVIVEYWAGTGDDQALLIIDFDENSTANSFAFGYYFNAAEGKTGEDMINAIADAGDLDVTASGTGVTFFLQDFAYLGNERGLNSTGEFWAYYVEDGDPLTSWTLPEFGAGTNDLSDKSWDGWSIPFGGEPDFLPPPPPDIRVVPIPGAVWLLGSGLVGLVGFRRRMKRK
jgi:hypothetical protein